MTFWFHEGFRWPAFVAGPREIQAPLVVTHMMVGGRRRAGSFFGAAVAEGLRVSETEGWLARSPRVPCDGVAASEGDLAAGGACVISHASVQSSLSFALAVAALVQHRERAVGGRAREFLQRGGD